MTNKRMESDNLSIEKQLGAIKKRWKEIFGIFYVFCDEDKPNRCGKDELELRKAKKRIMQRSFKEFIEDGETYLNCTKFQIVLEKIKTSPGSNPDIINVRIVLKIIRPRYLEELPVLLKNFFERFKYDLIEQRKGEYLIIKR
jgi:hypothetical protein